MRHKLLLLVLLVAPAIVFSCRKSSLTGPDPVRPQFYRLVQFGDSTVPTLFYRVFFGWVRIDSVKMIPYAVGRTIDQRLLNDRTGRGGTGGNTRDTTVARGQFMEIRYLSEMNSSNEVVKSTRDSSVVDVELRDTTFIVTRPHPDPTRTRVDTGHFAGDYLLLPVLVDYVALGGQVGTPFRSTFLFRIDR